jgi:glycosyltransferase involved in cell wall biosynthesis
MSSAVMKTIGFVVATKDRPDDLSRMLKSLAAQTRSPDLVAVVDSSAVPVSHLVNEFREQLPVHYLQYFPPSASAQRNAGIRAVPSSMDLIAFLDDDATLEPEALERMLAFWAKAAPDVGGAAFNMVNHPEQALSRLKRWPLVKRLGIYSGRPGQVMPSGWQTMTGFVSTDLFVDWLPSTAVVWRSKILRTCRFDEFYHGYSYLEDLDFSYMIRRRWRLIVVANARYYHYPSPIRHVRQYGFGRTEVRNRLYFVTQNGLSYPKCWFGLLLRMLMTFCDGALRVDRGAGSRGFGNFVEMAAEVRNLLTRSRIPRSSKVN